MSSYLSSLLTGFGILMIVAGLSEPAYSCCFGFSSCSPTVCKVDIITKKCGVAGSTCAGTNCASAACGCTAPPGVGCGCR